MIKIGTKIKGQGYSGEVVAVMFIGERYYALEDRFGAIFLMPASVIEIGR